MYKTQQSQAWRFGKSMLKSAVDINEISLPFGMKMGSSLERSIFRNGAFPKLLLYTNPEKRNSFSSALNQTDTSFRVEYNLERPCSSHDPWSGPGYAGCKFNFEYQIHKLTKTVNLKPVVNPGIRKTLYCKGLFTTTHAKKIRTMRRALISVVPECTARCASRGWLRRLPDRDSKPGSIGIGLASSLRAFPVGFENLASFVLPSPLSYLLESKWFQPKSSSRYSSINWFMGIRKNFYNLIVRLTLWLSSLGKKPGSCSGKHKQRSFFSFFNKQLSLTLNWRTCLGSM
jgi:hypothetical protein